MSLPSKNTPYQRKVTGAERFFAHAPFSTVTMVARIHGKVREDLFRSAVEKVQQRHALLQVRIRDTEDGDLWFTSDGVGEIPVEVVPRRTENDWIAVHTDRIKIPYDFEARPAVRLVLIHSEAVSELIILCHHMICDGMSLAYLARDLLVHLGDPAAEARVLPAPAPITLENLPGDAAPSGLIKYFINKIRQKWAEEYVHFNQQDYEALNRAYWEHYRHEILPVELTAEETDALVKRCRKEQVTVNTALITSFAGAQNAVMAPQPHHAKTVSAVSLRNRLPVSPQEGMGYYAQGMVIEFKYNPRKDFWENARLYHKKAAAKLSNKKVFGDLPSFLVMDSNIYEALNFKKLGALIQPGSPGYEKLHAFSQRDDVVVGLLKRAKMETLDDKLMGPAITNLGRLDFPTTYGGLELERLIMQPGGAFPLVHVDMVIGAATAAGKLSLVIEYAEEAVEPETMLQIKARALDLLLAA